MAPTFGGIEGTLGALPPSSGCKYAASNSNLAFTFSASASDMLLTSLSLFERLS